MSLILNIETSTSVCSVVLSKDNEIVIKKETNEQNAHSSILTVFIEEIFNEAPYNISKLDAVSVSKGPGSYTGLRIGVSVAKGIAYGIDKALISVSTLQAMALGMKENLLKKNIDISNILFCPMIDARRMEVYASIFDAELNTVKKISAEIIDENSFIEFLKDKKVYFFGDGAEKCMQSITHENAIFSEQIL